MPTSMFERHHPTDHPALGVDCNWNCRNEANRELSGTMKVALLKVVTMQPFLHPLR